MHRFEQRTAKSYSTESIISIQMVKNNVFIQRKKQKKTDENQWQNLFSQCVLDRYGDDLFNSTFGHKYRRGGKKTKKEKQNAWTDTVKL